MGRTTTVLVHAYLTTPATQSLVVPVALTGSAKAVTASGPGHDPQDRIRRRLAGRVDLTFRKRVGTTAGAMHGYLLARCSDGNFIFEPEVEFADGNVARGMLAEGCNPAGS